MREIDRRRWLAGAAALATLPAAAGAQEKAALYDYLFLDLNDAPAGSAPARAYVEQVRGRAAEIAADGGEVLGFFTPQLGWVGRQAALLVRWRPDAKRRTAHLQGLVRGNPVRFGQRAQLTATARPSATDLPQPGGIYVHRWFMVQPKDTAEFIELSQQGWRDFEARFDTKIFGLFTAERSRNDVRDGVTRFLLITRYKDHGVWETSRDPSTDAMAAFRRRAELTRDSWAASTLLTPI